MLKLALNRIGTHSSLSLMAEFCPSGRDGLTGKNSSFQSVQALISLSGVIVKTRVPSQEWMPFLLIIYFFLNQ